MDTRSHNRNGDGVAGAVTAFRNTPAMLPSQVAPEGAASHECVSVVVPCRNEAVWIETLLDALRSQDMPVFEVIIVDTGSTDRTVDSVGRYQQLHPELSVRCLSHPGVGIAGAVNRGIEVAQGEIIVRLDGHSCPATDYVKRAVEALTETGAAVVGGVWEIVPSAPNRTAEAIARAVAHPIGAGNAAYRTAGMRNIGRTAVDTVPFGCFRKTTWEALGGFNEDLLTNEDYEFNYRVRLGGAAVILDSEIRCAYFARGSLVDLASQYFRYGWWKAQMLRRYPRSLRWRQALPGALVPLFVCLAVVGFVWPVSGFLLGGCVLTYAAILSGAAVKVAARHGRWPSVFLLVAAFAVVHGTWSTGFAMNTLSFGRWPRWAGRGRGQAEAGQRGVGGVRLLQVLAAILVLTVLVPPGFATLVNRSRVNRAKEEVARLVGALQDTDLVDVARDQEADLLGGPGATPEAQGVSQWANEQVASLGDYVSQPLRPDPWGNRYMVNVGILRRVAAAGLPPAERVLWVLSAGPNGILETPYGSPAAAAVVGGDDVGARIAQ